MSSKSYLFATGVLFVSANIAWAGDSAIRFEDVTEQVGLAPTLEKWAFGHGGAWGDVNGDGRPDLYLGAFADRARVFNVEGAPIPNPLFLSTAGGFTLSPETSVRFQGQGARTTYAMFVDLDNDGDLDLFAGNHILHVTDDKIDKWWGDTAKASVIFENTGGGHFRDVTPPAADAGWPHGLAIRDASAVDLDHDGLLDLVLTDGNYENRGDGGGRLTLLANRGQWHFEDVTDQYGLPADHTPGTGLAIGDVNDDGQQDFFVAQANRLFVSQRRDAGDGWRYVEAEAGRFVGPRNTRGAMGAGAVFADLDNDGRLDLVTTVHARPGQVDVYMNRSTPQASGGDPAAVRFEWVTEQTGLPMLLPARGIGGMVVKAAHVAVQDIDCDGRNDLVFAILWRDAEGRDQPLVLRNLGVNEQGVPQFDTSPLDSTVVYAAPAPLADYDRDGRLDMIFVSWFSKAETVGTRLYRNVTPIGHHLVVRVRGDGKTMNTDGLGATVRLYKAGHLGEADSLLARQDITTGQGYSSGTEPLAYFGLGDRDKCDVHVQWGDLEATRRDVQADQTLGIPLPNKQP